MKCRELMSALHTYAPSEFACDWDNVGLLVGDEEDEITSIYIALDPTDEAVSEAIAQKADLLLTHHPLLLKGINKICRQDFMGRRIYQLIQNKISCLAMHTNFDVCHMGRLAADLLALTEREVLEVTGTAAGRSRGIGVIGKLPEKMKLQECARAVKKAFLLNEVRVFGDLNREISHAALCPGSGKSLSDIVLKTKAEVYITGDIGHHEGIDLAAQGVAVIDGGHYGIEKLFIGHMAEFLTHEFPGISVFTQARNDPFINL